MNRIAARVAECFAPEDDERKKFLDRNAFVRCRKCGKLMTDRQVAMYADYHLKCAPPGSKGYELRKANRARSAHRRD